jgi:hypothetical protein
MKKSPKSATKSPAPLTKTIPRKCAECGANYPSDATSQFGVFHRKPCSNHTKNTLIDRDGQRVRVDFEESAAPAKIEWRVDGQVRSWQPADCAEGDAITRHLVEAGIAFWRR